MLAADEGNEGEDEADVGVGAADCRDDDEEDEDDNDDDVEEETEKDAEGDSRLAQKVAFNARVEAISVSPHLGSRRSNARLRKPFL